MRPVFEDFLLRCVEPVETLLCVVGASAIEDDVVGTCDDVDRVDLYIAEVIKGLDDTGFRFGSIRLRQEGLLECPAPSLCSFNLNWMGGHSERVYDGERRESTTTSTRLWRISAPEAEDDRASRSLAHL